MFEMLKRALLTTLIFLMPFSQSAADILDNIIERGTLRVGVTLFEPNTMQDATGKLTGFDIEVANKLTKDLGVEPEFLVYNWADIITALKNREIDIILAGVAITPARALNLNFSQPYSELGIGIATNTRMTRKITKLGDLNTPKYSIAVVSDTVSHDFVRRNFDQAQIKTYKTSEEAGSAVSQDKAHVFVASVPQPKFLSLSHPSKVDSPLTKPLVSYKVGMGVSKGEQEWLNFLNSWITARQADKWLSTTHKYWYDSLRWRKEGKK